MKLWALFIFHPGPESIDPGDFAHIHIDAIPASTPEDAVRAHRDRFPDIYRDSDLFMAVGVEPDAHPIVALVYGNLKPGDSPLISTW